jgi:hypothetical protein
MGKTHSKPLAALHGRGTAWARHAMCQSALEGAATGTGIDASGWFDLYECMMMYGLTNPTFTNQIISIITFSNMLFTSFLS